MEVQTITSIPIYILSSKQNKEVMNTILSYINISTKFIFINEGSHTRSINYLNGNKVNITILEHSHTKRTKNARIIRHVWLETSSYAQMTFARSLWIIKKKETDLNQRDIPIGNSFIKKKQILVNLS